MTSLYQLSQDCPDFKTKNPASQEHSQSQASQDGGRCRRSLGCTGLLLCTTCKQSRVSRNLYSVSTSLFSLTLILPAVLLGKHQPGVDKPDPKTWKANFRCAMNSLPDIEEVKDRSIKKGNNAFRVYRMLPLSERPSKKGR